MDCFQKGRYDKMKQRATEGHFQRAGVEIKELISFEELDFRSAVCHFSFPSHFLLFLDGSVYLL